APRPCCSACPRRLRTAQSLRSFREAGGGWGRLIEAPPRWNLLLLLLEADERVVPVSPEPAVDLRAVADIERVVDLLRLIRRDVTRERSDGDRVGAQRADGAVRGALLLRAVATGAPGRAELDRGAARR